MAKNDTQETETETGDAPLIDLNDAQIKKLLARAKKRGIITVDELNEALPQDQMSSEQIEDVMSAINDMGVQIVENEDSDDEDKEPEPEEEVDPLDDGGPRLLEGAVGEGGRLAGAPLHDDVVAEAAQLLHRGGRGGDPALSGLFRDDADPGHPSSCARIPAPAQPCGAGCVARFLRL